ncbi:Ank3 [Symbiodinium natans]|uniref:Ank3 protein n=1 Tax=Symbiodinium natans TaxID=878477 RepID=A0A812PI34_9DINO|nr:Ank3 [Symbiodinium natans]
MQEDWPSGEASVVSSNFASARLASRPPLAVRDALASVPDTAVPQEKQPNPDWLPSLCKNRDMFADESGRDGSSAFGRSGTFTVEIPLPSSKPAQLGLDLDAIDPKGPIIVSVMPGVLKDFNDSNPATALQAYDRIEAVNGETGDPAKLYKAMSAAMEDLTKGKFTLKINRPRTFSASITKTGEPLGTQLNFKVSSAGIVVTRVSSGGLIAKHNDTCLL